MNISAYFKRFMVHIHPSLIHLFDVIAAPTKAQITDNQSAQQDFKPKTPSRYILSTVTNIAQIGATIQNTIN